MHCIKGGNLMANNKYQLGIYNDYPLSAPFPQKVTLTHTETVITITKSDGSQMTRRETTKQISYDPAPSNYKRLPKR
jgi:hypothetical protein